MRRMLVIFPFCCRWTVFSVRSLTFCKTLYADGKEWVAAFRVSNLPRMIMTLHIPELQKILGLLKLSKSGKKVELMQRLVIASTQGLPKAVQNEIESLYRQKFHTVTYVPKTTPVVTKSPEMDLAAVHSYKMYSNSSVPVVPQVSSQLPIHPDVKLKPLPFYRHIATLLKPATLVPTSTAVCQEASFSFHLTPQQAIIIGNRNNEGSEIAQIQLRFCWLETSCEQDDNFPPSLTVKVNNRVVSLPSPIPTNKPGVEPRRLPQPLNITPLCQINAIFRNQIVVNWASEYGRNYCVAVNLVMALSSDILLSKLKQNGVRHQFHTRALIKEKLALDVDSEIATTSLRISLLCPLGKMKMTVPSRASTCNHLQCFDAATFLQMNEKKPTWTCPVCDKPAEFQNLVIDGLFTEILKKSSKATEIQFTEDGEWQPMNSKDDECWVSDSPSSQSIVETSKPCDLNVIDLTETDDETDNMNSSIMSQCPSLIGSSSYSSVISADNIRTISSQDFDRDSPVVISIDTPPLPNVESYFYHESFPGLSEALMPRPPPAHSKISVSNYSSLRGPGFLQNVTPLDFYYDNTTLPLPLTSQRVPAHTNNRDKSHHSLHP